jgi:hypothetical protein
MVTSDAVTTVVGKQRRTLTVALLLSGAAIWITTPLGQWQSGVFFSVGVFLSLLNHVLTQLALYRALDNADGISRKQFAVGSMGRLGLVTAIAAVIVIAFWPYGAAVLIGLALFHLVILVFTGLPLLNEIRKA